MVTGIVNYDAQGYDYRSFWRGRDYELWAERRALRRAVARLGPAEWFVDLGGGFGRNAEHYRRRVGRYVLVDYSATNLGNAASLLSGDIAAGTAFLVRSDLAALPFADHAFDAGMVVRVLHHLTDLDAALAEMGRTIAGRWLLDVPVKHHALGVLRGALHRDLAAVLDGRPVRTGSTDEAFWNFQLAAVRRTLAGAGWRTRAIASVNNLRRWDQRLPRPAVALLRPAAYLAEAAAQRCGRGWWGPSQFVLAARQPATRQPVQQPAPRPRPSARAAERRLPGGVPEIAYRMVCPACAGGLDWTPDRADCTGCGRRYPKTRGFWDFTLPTP